MGDSAHADIQTVKKKQEIQKWRWEREMSKSTNTCRELNNLIKEKKKLHDPQIA